MPPLRPSLSWPLLLLFGCAGGSTPELSGAWPGQVGAPPPCAFAGDPQAAKRFVSDILVEVRTRGKMMEHGIDANMDPFRRKRWEGCGLSRGSAAVEDALDLTCPERDVPLSELRAIAISIFVACDNRMPG